MTPFAGKGTTDVYRAVVLVRALKRYAETKTLLHKAWTPTIMLSLVTYYTGRIHKRGAFDLAIEDMQGWLSDAKRAR